MQLPHGHCPKCGRSTAIQSVLMVVLDFSNWVQLIISVAVIAFVSSQFALSGLETTVILAVALVAMVTSVRRKNFCERCEIEFVPGPNPAPRPPV